MVRCLQSQTPFFLCFMVSIVAAKHSRPIVVARFCRLALESLIFCSSVFYFLCLVCEEDGPLSKQIVPSSRPPDWPQSVLNEIALVAFDDRNAHESSTEVDINPINVIEFLMLFLN